MSFLFVDISYDALVLVHVGNLKDDSSNYEWIDRWIDEIYDHFNFRRSFYNIPFIPATEPHITKKEGPKLKLD